MTDIADRIPDDTPPSPDRRSFLKTAGIASAAGAVAGAAHGKFGLAPIASAQAQPAAPPKLTTEKWWPSKWGAEDEAGASNHITPAKVLDAAKWIRDGKVYKMGRVYEQAMPCFGQRAFLLRIPGGPTGGPFGENKLVYNDEFLATEIGQTGTQFDGLGHIGIQMGKDGDKSEMYFYNGFTSAQMSDPYGLKKLGTEKLKPLITRGHLVDIAAVKGGTMDAGQEIMVADVRAALHRQNMQESEIKPGDAIFFNTGWGSLWMKNNDRFNSGEPGIGLEVARWVIDKDLCLTGGDTWAVEVVPNPDKSLAFPCHSELQTKHGIFNHENLTFDDLIADRKYQFVFIFTPAPIKGATGSNGCPIAIT
ncbi:MAG: cyclase family protein [Alphaproteobacteria bacterium]|nr:MAG: cyclase family protein [Alphaproteobacteria bacterium]